MPWQPSASASLRLERMSWAILKLWRRAEALEMTEGDSVALPWRQQDLADALGLSLVHTNKTLARLKREGLVTNMAGEGSSLAHGSAPSLLVLAELWPFRQTDGEIYHKAAVLRKPVLEAGLWSHPRPRKGGSPLPAKGEGGSGERGRRPEQGPLPYAVLSAGIRASTMPAYQLEPKGMALSSKL
ncbi:MAG: helix-turn-helix domain-containing protein [Gemmobacter sp.]|nr:helix-turn-helix domain-containing protein [Gemmobacter sp.]